MTNISPTEKEKIKLAEDIIKALDRFIDGHGFCMSIASAHSSAKKLHKLLTESASN